MASSLNALLIALFAVSFACAFVGPFKQSDMPEYYKCMIDYLDQLATRSPGNGIDKLWAKEKPKLQGQIVQWIDCFNKKSDMMKLTCHLRQGSEAVRLISLAAHSMKIKNSKLVTEFYDNYKAKCKAYRA